ncbi:MAG: glycosyltransferase [Desulfobulbus sp.]|nr:glycosyltransferase [Desulfobulbus sp.]
MTFTLEKQGYQFDREQRIWMRCGYGGIKYSDGNAVEQHLARILTEAKDLSIFSVELAAKCTDWPSLYHLASTRTNILRPFQDILHGARVLEIGAGCGAITRFLGESGVDVLALEGSPRRAAIARTRTRDLPNVTVLAEKFDQFRHDQRFDVITLIGALEYANLFTSDENPPLAMLRQIRSLLQPDGKLIIAIENQLGLKYFAGAPEDHIGQSMYGIEGRYRKDQPQTFGRKVLAQLLCGAGFASAQFMAPFPDYKFPVSIVTEEGFSATDFDASSLAWQSVRRDPQLPPSLSFSPELTWPAIFKNGIALDLANSFLVVASPSGGQHNDGYPLAYHYSTDRRPEFCRETRFVRNASGLLSVHYRRLARLAGKATKTPDSGYRFLLPENDVYTLGCLFSKEFVDLVSNPGWAIQDVAAFIDRYISLLRRLLNRDGYPSELKSVYEKLPGRYLDAVPQNLVLDADGQVAFIDAEWTAEFGIELGHLLFRGLLWLIAGVSRVASPCVQDTLTRRWFIEGVLEECGLSLSSADFSRYLKLEAGFQEFVTGRSAREFMNWWPEELLPGLGAEQDNVTLYWAPQNEDFSENSAVRLPIDGLRGTIEFVLPESTPPMARLRLDPFEQKGWNRVFSLELLDKVGNKRWVWEFGTDDVAMRGLHALQDRQKQNTILLYAFDADPQLLINLPLEVLRVLESGWRLRLDLEILAGKDIVEVVAERDGLINSLNKTVVKRDGLIDSLNQTAAERDALIDSLNQTVTERDGLIDRLTHEIKALRHSTSWKLTTPLRWPIHQLKRARHLARIAPRALEVGGGIGPTTMKAWRLYRSEGLAGLKRGIVSVQSPSEIKPTSQSNGFDRNDYEEWVRRYDTLDDNARQRITDLIAAFPREPKISVLMPVYDPPLNFLDAAIWSVRKQLYPHWELCIADDASKNQAVRDLLNKHAKEDERIKVVCRTTNGHISAASNSALELATGEFVALLDHDDLLTEHALFWIAQTTLGSPDVGLIYSDEDKIDESGKRYHPYFKCELNPELLLAQNMICHLGVYRRDLLETTGRFRTGFEGAQDYDLALRVIERLAPEQIKHIPRVLYHWRAIAGSTALASSEKNYAAEAGRKAVTQHLQRRGLQAEVCPAPDAPTMNRVRFALPSPAPLVTIIIPTRDRADLLATCINSILTLSTYPALEIVIVDNGSVQPETAKFFTSLPPDQIKIIRDDLPFNFSRLNNLGAQKARGEILCLMNNDIEVLSPDWLEEMVSFACRPEVGCVGARMWYPDGRLQHGGVLLGVGRVAGHSHKYLSKGHPGYFCRANLHQNLSAVTAACLTIRRSVYQQVGGLDETFAVAFNDVDFCLRVREAGYRNVWTPYAEMIHHESVTRGAEDTPEKQARFRGEVRKMQERWGKALLNDPAYSPNLTLDHEDFSLAWPPRVDLQMTHKRFHAQ